MNTTQLPRPRWIVVASLISLLFACGKPEPVSPPVAMPELNDANCRSDAIKALPAELRQTFAQQCVRRSKPIHSEEKSYKF